MDIIDSRVRKCEDITEIIEKIMITREITNTKYILPLEVDIPFEDDDSVKILRREDFEMIGELMKQLQRWFKQGNIEQTILIELQQKGGKRM